MTTYPCVPGHEIVGRVTKVGSAVTKFRPGDIVGVGCLVDSDGTCPECQAGYEQFCRGAVFTYNAPDKHLGGVTYDGHSESVVVDERFVLRVPPDLDLAGVSPLLCAGITSYAPMRRQGVTKGKRVCVVGLGGLGHVGVKLGRALGAHVVVFTTSPERPELAAHQPRTEEADPHAAPPHLNVSSSARIAFRSCSRLVCQKMRPRRRKTWRTRRPPCASTRFANAPGSQATARDAAVALPMAAQRLHRAPVD